MPFTIHVTSDFDQMSAVAADIVAADIKEKQASKPEYVLGLATGNSPTGLYKHLAKAFNAGVIDPARVRTFNLDEYVGLPGENAQQRALHRESYSYFMTTELFGLMRRKFVETNVPWGTLVDQDELVSALESQPGEYELQGTDKGKAVVIGAGATGVLREIKDDGPRRLRPQDRRLRRHRPARRRRRRPRARGVPRERHPVRRQPGPAGEARRQHRRERGRRRPLPHQAGQPLVRHLHGHGAGVRGAQGGALANGARKTGPVAESILGEVTCDVPISYGQQYAAGGGDMVYVLDEAAAADVLDARDEVAAKGYEIVDHRGQPYTRVADLTFSRDADSGLVG